MIIKLSRLTVPEKIDLVISRYKQKGYKTITARDVAKVVDMTSNRAANFLKFNNHVKYSGKEKGEWEIL